MNTEILIILLFSLILIAWILISIFALRVAHRSKKLSGKLLPVSILFLMLSAMLMAISFYYLWEVQKQIPAETTHNTTSASYY
jgi:uncharacterized SAM-binding protein YcdF (DUF218 family)